MSVINQKEYLKKYLKIGKNMGEKRKKKKSDKIVSNRLKVIDDDLDVSISHEIQDDLDAANEDAPQIVAVIDERPLSMQIDEKTNTCLWKPIGPAAPAPAFQGFKMNSIKLNANEEKSNKQIKLSVRGEKESSIKSDCLPFKKEDRDCSSPKRNKISCKSPTRLKETDISPARRRNIDSDYSPPRKSKNNKSPSPKCIKEDISPPRRRNKGSEYSSPRISKTYNYYSSTRQKEADISPPRKRNIDSDSSPLRAHKKREAEISASRRSINSPLKKKLVTEDCSSPRQHKSIKKSRWENDTPVSTSIKPETTMSGKKSGLQLAQNVVEDLLRIQKQEEQLFKTMSSEISGANAATIVRKKKEKTPDPVKIERERQLKEKYQVWGKGVKQVQDAEAKMADELKEMQKPLARYADDEDLEKYLKEQEREGDPMLAYLRKKKKKKAVEMGVPEKPVYGGDFMLNRFGIRPGYRWDGVDRSNGYERKWFESLNQKKAQQEEAMLWSQEDM